MCFQHEILHFQSLFLPSNALPQFGSGCKFYCPVNTLLLTPIIRWRFALVWYILTNYNWFVVSELTLFSFIEFKCFISTLISLSHQIKLPQMLVTMLIHKDDICTQSILYSLLFSLAMNQTMSFSTNDHWLMQGRKVTVGAMIIVSL